MWRERFSAVVSTRPPLTPASMSSACGTRAGKLLATQTATGETASGKQSVMFASPVQIAAKQTVTCGYFAPQGHYSDDLYAFTAQKDAAPLHVPINGGVAVYSTQATTFPTTAFQASSYWVDVLFAPPSSATWISGTNVVPTTDGANITWTTAVPSTSQVEYGPTTAYGNTTVMAQPRWPGTPSLCPACRPEPITSVCDQTIPMRCWRRSRLHPCPVASGESLCVALERERRLGPSPAVDGNREQYPEPIGRMVGNGRKGQFIRVIHGSDRDLHDSGERDRNQPG